MAWFRPLNYRKHQTSNIKKEQNMNAMKAIWASIFGLAALAMGWLSFYTIDQGSRGVILTNGAISGVAEPGLGFKFPLITSVVRISVQDRAQVYENLLAYSKDQQTAGMRVSVSYQIPPSEVATIYSDYGSEDALVNRLLDRQVPKVLEEVFGQFNAVTAIQDRARLGTEVQAAIQKSVIGPITIKSVQIENIDFSDAYEGSIEQRMLAEVEVQRVRQNAEREKVEAEIVVIKAEAAAKAQIAAAEAASTAIRLRGDADADAIRAKSAALSQNPALIALTQAERWNGVLPSTMVPGSTVPFLDLSYPSQ